MHCGHDSDQEMEDNACVIQRSFDKLSSFRFYSILIFMNLLSILSTLKNNKKSWEEKPLISVSWQCTLK